METTTEIMGSVHSWELVTAVDGPGTRMTVFLSGCPLRCLYCHNPDTRYASQGTQTSSADILKRVKRYSNIFATTGGGLTISGGEPMMQPKFLRALVEGAKAQGVHVTVDTCGYLGKFIGDDLLEQVDLFLLDIKSGDEDTYKKTTKRSLQPTLDLAQRLSAMGKRVWVRFVLVPGLTDSEDNVEKVAQHVLNMGSCVEKVEVLPFHQMGKAKWEDLGLDYELADTTAPSSELVQRVAAQFEDKGITVTVG